LKKWAPMAAEGPSKHRKTSEIPIRQPHQHPKSMLEPKQEKGTVQEGRLTPARTSTRICLAFCRCANPVRDDLGSADQSEVNRILQVEFQEGLDERLL
jgi:hypothetical protein